MDDHRSAESPYPPPPPTHVQKPRSANVTDIKQIKRLCFVRLMDFVSGLGDCILLEPKPKPPDGYKHIFTAKEVRDEDTMSIQETQELVSFWRCVSGDLLRAAMKHARQKLEDKDTGDDYDPTKMHLNEMVTHRHIVSRLLVVNGFLDRCLSCGKQWKADGGANVDFVKNHLLQGDYQSLAKPTSIVGLQSGTGNQNVWWNIIPTCCSDTLLTNPKKTDLLVELGKDLNIGMDSYPENLLVGLAFWFRVRNRDDFSLTRDLLDKKKQNTYKDKLQKERDRCLDEMFTCAKAADNLMFAWNKPWQNIEESLQKELLDELKSFVDRTKKFDGSIAEIEFESSDTATSGPKLTKKDASLVRSLQNLRSQVNESRTEDQVTQEGEDENTDVRECIQNIVKCIDALSQASLIKRNLEDISRALNSILPNLHTLIKDRQTRVKNIAMSFFVHLCRLLAETGYSRPQETIDEDSLINFVLGFFFINTDPRKAVNPEEHELLDWRFLKLNGKEQGLFKKYDTPASSTSTFTVED